MCNGFYELDKEQNAEECDATAVDNRTKAGYKKFNITGITIKTNS